MKTEPFRFWSLSGAAHAAALAGNPAKAEAYYALLVGHTASADVQEIPGLEGREDLSGKE
jgi:hypothetical protein